MGGLGCDTLNDVVDEGVHDTHRQFFLQGIPVASSPLTCLR